MHARLHTLQYERKKAVGTVQNRKNDATEFTRARILTIITAAAAAAAATAAAATAAAAVPIVAEALTVALSIVCTGTIDW